MFDGEGKEVAESEHSASQQAGGPTVNKFLKQM